MPFSSNPVNPSPLQSRLKRHPALFGVPFLLIIVGASFGLQTFTQTRYDLQDQKVKQISNEQALGLDRKKKKFDIREEYYKLSAAGEQDWEPKRIARPNDFPELGVPPTEPPVKS
ncbi:cytochrome c oxidase assembly protein COX16-domain-containing protein [Suillus subaureus]|uniref:Cytochrome c oxidase assembly protein COX16, mitochondrial n=1 Tax=Suillus subaureus TaxID=48587 RepID=A0A9P7EPG9_9AGAM|nr:cytochrome c oxidase assembly protein COX16-domain-containing protein [Suillus subaureus]KAG1827602.1 cytochrome c oxidase assembly protein COX16-domain-containing protein [Suillus subaureus]